MSERPLSEAERKRRLALVFGDVLPDATADDRPDRGAGGGSCHGPDGDDWLRREVPPHHG